MSYPYGRHVNKELRTVNGSGLKSDPIAAIDLKRDVVKERPGRRKILKFGKRSALRKARSVPLFDARRNSSLACHAVRWVNGAKGTSGMAGGWDHDLGGVFSGRAQRELPEIQGGSRRLDDGS